MNNIASMKNNIEEMRTKLKEMESSLEKMKKDSGWGYTGDDYVNIYSISATGIVEGTNCSHYSPHALDIHDNIFTSKEKAEEVASAQNLHRKLQRFADESKQKGNAKCFYAIYWYNGTLEISETKYPDFGTVYFYSEEVAKKAVELYKFDLLAYFTKWTK